jgi:ABC-type polysaccharide/polyol phosphate export permease
MIFYGSPIIYQVSQLPPEFQLYAGLNPISHFLEEIRAIMFFGKPPTLYGLTIMSALACASLVIGVTTYRLNKNRFIYHL